MCMYEDDRLHRMHLGICMMHVHVYVRTRPSPPHAPSWAELVGIRAMGRVRLGAMGMGMGLAMHRAGKAGSEVDRRGVLVILVRCSRGRHESHRMLDRRVVIPLLGPWRVLGIHVCSLWVLRHAYV